MAGDLFKYLIIIAGLSILLPLAGINTSAGLLISNLFSDPEQIAQGTLFELVAGIIGLVAVGGIIIGSIARSPIETILLAPLAAITIWFVMDIISIITYANGHYSGWVATIIGAILVPIAIGYIYSVISWWAGR